MVSVPPIRVRSRAWLDHEFHLAPHLHKLAYQNIHAEIWGIEGLKTRDPLLSGFDTWGFCSWRFLDIHRHGHSDANIRILVLKNRAKGKKGRHVVIDPVYCL